jgi:hypothetical protein
LQECAVIARLELAFIWNELLEPRGTVLALLALAAVFASGVFDALVLKKRDWACATWFLGIISLSAWMISSWTIPSIVAGGLVFALGLALLIVYYQGHA